MTGQGSATHLDLLIPFQQIGQILVTSLDLQDALNALVDQAMALIDVDVVLLRLLDRSGENLELQVARGAPEEVVHQMRFQPDEGLAGRLLLDGKPIRGINLQQDPYTTQRALARRHGWQSFAAVALHLHRQPIGVWFLIRRRRQPFSDRELALLTCLADYASLAVERSLLLHTIVQEKHESEILLQASADGILVVDAQGRIVDVNPALERLIGFARRDVRGLPCCDILGCGKEHPDLGHAPGCPLHIQENQHEGVYLEYDVHTRDGRPVPVEASYGLIRDDHGALERVMVVLRDVSRQKELDRLRAEIVANVSHELRTPLALIKGYATTLLNPSVTVGQEESSRFLKNVSVAADHLGRMIDDLLCASRIETQQLQLHIRPMDLGHRLRKVLAWLEPHAQERLLVADVPPGVLRVHADPDRVQQVLVNLLTNAIKYSPVGSTIRVQARALGNTPKVVVHVIDRGVGIAPEHLPHIFERFYVTGTGREAVGLGLYICRGLVEAMGGEIWAISELGKGSTFSFTLPAETDRAAIVAGEKD